jgi:hypothetical protein
VQSGYDDVAVDRLAAARPVLENSLCLGEEDESLLNEIVVDESLGLKIIGDEFLHVFVWVSESYCRCRCVRAAYYMIDAPSGAALRDLRTLAINLL